MPRCPAGPFPYPYRSLYCFNALRRHIYFASVLPSAGLPERSGHQLPVIRMPDKVDIVCHRTGQLGLCAFARRYSNCFRPCERSGVPGSALPPAPLSIQLLDRALDVSSRIRDPANLSPLSCSREAGDRSGSYSAPRAS